MRIVRTAAVAIGCLVGVVILLVVAATLYLTPANLARILDREASEYFKADIRVSNPRFTFWSTFPRLHIEIDSLRIDSRTLRGVDKAIRERLPADADSLASTGGIKGSVDVMKLLGGKIWVEKLSIDRLNLNMVAYNDSINNYNIIPDSDGDDSPKPYFTVGSIDIRRPYPLRFFSAATATKATADVSQARFVRLKDSLDSYTLSFGGRLSAEVRKFKVLSSFPFSMLGRVNLRFDPFRVGFRDFALDLGNTHGNLDMSLDLGKEMRVNNLTYNIKTFNLAKFLNFIPGLESPILKGLEANISVDASARLTAPYTPSATRLPSFEVMLSIPEGDMVYTLADGRRYPMSHSAASGRFVFRGDRVGESYFELSPVELRSDGISMKLGARVDSLLGDPRAEALLNLVADLRRLGREKELRPFALKGHVDADARATFSLRDLNNPSIEDVAVSGHVAGSGLSALCGLSGVRLLADALSVDFVCKADRLGSDAIEGGSVEGKARLRTATLLAGGTEVKATGLDVKGSSRSRIVDASILSRKIPYSVSGTASSLAVTSPADTVKAVFRRVGFSTDAASVGRFGTGSSGWIAVSAAGAEVKAPSVSTEVKGIRMKVGAERFAKGSLAARNTARPAAHADSATLRRVPHSPEYLTMRLPASARDIIDSWKMKVALTAAGGSIISRAFPERTYFSGLDLLCTPDSVALRDLSLRCRRTAMSLSGSAGNLRAALTSPYPVELPVNLDIALDTVNINQLARAYEKTHPHREMTPAELAASAGLDTLTLLVPRNLLMHLRATADETVYTNLHLTDLAADVTLRDGLARVSDLRIGSDFGHAWLDFDYDSRDASRIGVKASLGVLQIDVETFFERFHTLMLMMPQMKNLSGYLSAELKGSLGIFPDMYVNVPSVEAKVAVQGRDLKVHQNKFIRRITRMMLIPDSRDIHIRNMDVHASVHDNLLELYPFDFEFSNYKLRMAGLNNFDGLMYYHIGVDDNPLHFPFGINIQGHYSDPQLRFGGATYKEQRAFDITSRIMTEKRVNFVKELKHYLREFVHKAAVSPDE